jgi:hypothetical protein
VEAYYLRHIGKETDRRWEQGEDISILDPFTLEYCPNEAEHLSIDPDLEIGCVNNPFDFSQTRLA